MELLPLVCLCLLSCSGDAVRVVVEEGSDAVLPCLISTKEDISGKYFDWKKDGQTEVFLYDAGVHYNNGRQGQDDQFKGRVSFFQDQLENGDASIKITRTKMADSGTYSCDFPRHQPRQASIIELVVGAASEPYVTTVKTDDGVMLQCKVRGAFPKPKVEWKDSSGNILPVKEVNETEKGDLFYIILRADVTKTDTFRCVVNQEEIGHQTEAEIYVVNGAASEPSVKTIKTDKGVMLQCKVLGASPEPKVEWKDRSGNTLKAEEPQVTESGGRYDIVLRAAVTKTDTFRCVVTQEEISHQISDEIYAVNGAASKPYVKTIQTDDGMMLQCEVLGASPKPKVEWKDSSGNILQTEEPQVTERGGRYDIVLRAAVTKTDTFRCVVTQEEISHQTEAEIYVVKGSNTGWIIAGVFIGLFVVAVVAVVLYFKDRIRQICVKCSRRNRANGRTGTSERPSNLELLSVPDPAELIENHSAPV